MRNFGTFLMIAGMIVAGCALLYPKAHQEVLERRTEAALTEYQQREVLAPRSLPLPSAQAPSEPEVTVAQGEVWGTVSIPALEMETIVTAGVTDDELDVGTGHYLHTGLPGQERTVGLAVHRGLVVHIDDLEPGAEVVISTEEGDWVYTWSGYEIVNPEDVHVLDDEGVEKLVITTCHPWGSTAHRLVGTAILKEAP